MQNLYELLKQKVPGFRVDNYFRSDHPWGAKFPAKPKINYLVVNIKLDGGGLPLRIDDRYSVEEYIDEMSQIQIVNLTGIEVIFTEPRLNRLKALYLKDWPPMPTIVLTTKDGSGWYRSGTPGVVTYRPLPVMHPQQFYSPKYNVAPVRLLCLIIAQPYTGNPT
ncbi:hypothetical protein HK413_07040 [Mucilaginibacter sp. S1162]|uniref:Uncharacterized protein n=1 Tax=Mucilaginibacter humi TaxID=2732510 RepID=A0ABX1W158_9SPHI|nr:hypothetical protein [Mucilaginibacter humi]NNU33969.1 hypothetical protein [Mucilaginibacter humi]